MKASCSSPTQHAECLDEVLTSILTSRAWLAQNSVALWGVPCGSLVSSIPAISRGTSRSSAHPVAGAQGPRPRKKSRSIRL
jgi:hypothetical protein